MVASSRQIALVSLLLIGICGLVLPAEATPPTTRLVSVNQTGTASGNSVSVAPVITPNGRFVAFESLASDLTANNTNGTLDIFVRDLKTGTTTLVSVNQPGTASGNDDSFAPVMSGNGRFVAFDSDASDLVANDTNGTLDIFVRDLKTGTTTLVSVNQAGTASGNDFSELLAISPNGRFVAFDGRASDLTGNDSNGKKDVFVRDLK